MKETILIGAGCMLSAFFMVEMFRIFVIESANKRKPKHVCKTCPSCRRWINDKGIPFKSLPKGDITFKPGTICLPCRHRMLRGEGLL